MPDVPALLPDGSQNPEYQRQYREENKERLQQLKKEYRRNIRLEGIRELGGVCECCGEDKIEFLTLEHLNGREGLADHHKTQTGQQAFLRAKSEGWPRDEYALLCYNCNCAKNTYVECPHKTGATTIDEVEIHFASDDRDKPSELPPRPCPVCGNMFRPYRAGRKVKTCSRQCGGKLAAYKVGKEVDINGDPEQQEN